MFDNLFQIAAEANKPEPKFKVGDTVWVTEVDVVLKCSIESVFDIHDSDDCFSEYGYRVSGEANNVLWDHSIGKELFSDEASALAQAEYNAEQVDKISFTIDDIEEGEIRENEEWKILYSYCFLLKNDTVVWSLPYCYTFAKKCNNKEEAKKLYKNHLNSINRENSTVVPLNDNWINVDNDLYYCDSNDDFDYSSFEYFYNNYFGGLGYRKGQVYSQQNHIWKEKMQWKINYYLHYC